MVADVLSRNSMESLSHIEKQRRDIVSDLQRLFEVGLSLEATEKRCSSVRSILFDLSAGKI